MSRVPISVAEIIAALEREIGNPAAWLATKHLRQMPDFQKRTLMCAVDQRLDEIAVARQVCPHCRLCFPNGGTCRFGGCPMGGDF